MDEKKGQIEADNTDGARGNHVPSPSVVGPLFVPGEGAWMLIGCVLGYLLPVVSWIGLDLKVWVVLLAAIGSLELVLAGKLVKANFRKPSAMGWSISSIAQAMSAPDTPPRSRILGYVAMTLFAKAMLIGGLLFGQFLSIFFRG